MKMSKHQMTVLETLYDVATHEGGGIILKNRYHSPAHALIRKGYVREQDRFPWRPLYFITEAGMAYWSSLLTQDAAELANTSGEIDPTSPLVNPAYAVLGEPANPLI